MEATSKKMNLPVSKISEHEETYSTSLFSMLLPLGSDSIAKQDEIYNVQKEVIREMVAGMRRWVAFTRPGSR